jgi:hypothetical protein
MGKFSWGDAVRIRADAPSYLRPGALASVYDVSEGKSRFGEHFDSFPPGTVYSVEYEDSSAVEVHEDHLESPDERDKA